MEAPQKRQTDLTNVFISYKRDCADQHLATRLATDLQAKGVKVWRDKTNIAPGKYWDESVKKGIKQCAQFLIVLSPKAVESNNVVSELHYAMGKRKWVIPLRHEQCEPPLIIGRNHQVDFTGSYEAGFAELMGLPPPPFYWLYRILNFFERTWGRMLAAILVIALAFAAWWFLTPSKTTSAVIGAEVLSRADPKDMRGPIPAIKVQFDNGGGRPSTLAGEYRLIFPPEIPFAPQPLKLAEKSPEEVPGRGHLVIKLTASGLESKQLQDGSFLDRKQAMKLLPGRQITLYYRIKESSGSQSLQSQTFPAELLRDLIWLRSRAGDFEEDEP